MTRGICLKSRIKELREQYGLTQKQLGEKVGVSRQAINAIETGKFDPSIWLAYDLAKFFNLSIEELFNFKESERE
jgi:putative transcriptional regulator